eukprot:361197-Chlamydomonas_euryale.AAC.4
MHQSWVCVPKLGSRSAAPPPLPPPNAALNATSCLPMLPALRADQVSRALVLILLSRRTSTRAPRKHPTRANYVHPALKWGFKG